MPVAKFLIAKKMMDMGFTLERIEKELGMGKGWASMARKIAPVLSKILSSNTMLRRSLLLTNVRVIGSVYRWVKRGMDSVEIEFMLEKKAERALKRKEKLNPLSAGILRDRALLKGAMPPLPEAYDRYCGF